MTDSIFVYTCKIKSNIVIMPQKKKKKKKTV